MRIWVCGGDDVAGVGRFNSCVRTDSRVERMDSGGLRYLGVDAGGGDEVDCWGQARGTLPTLAGWGLDVTCG